MELVNSVFSWIIKKRIHQMELFMKHPIDVQNELFLNLINTAKNTEWGIKYDYKSIKNYNDYKNRVPLQDYASLKDKIIRIKHGEQNVLWPTDIKWFAKSSGTSTGKSKFIPVSKESLIDCHYKGGKDLLSIYHNNHPKSKLILGKVLVVGGSSAINSFSDKSYYGDLSAIIMKNFPMWVEQRRVPKMDIAIMDDWEKKIELMAKSTAKENVSNISGVPSWTLVLIKRILELNNTSDIFDIWPNLELFMHGGVNFSPYREEFKKFAPGNRLNYYENYNATEGFFGLQDQSKVEEMLLMLDYGIFYEFIEISEIDKEEPCTITLENVVLNKNYAVVITTNAGLWRYVIGDTVKFTNLCPFRIKVTGRISQFINAFGEELIVDNADKALSKACEKTASILKEYTVAPQFFTGKSTGQHQWLIEFEQAPENIEYFSTVLDQELQLLNSDYEAKRYNDMILKEQCVKVIPRGTFYKWMKQKGKLGGQHKIPRLSNNSKYIDELLQMV